LATALLHQVDRAKFPVFVSAGSGSDIEQIVHETDLALCAWIFEDAVTAPDHAYDLEALDRGGCRLHCLKAAHPSDHRLERAAIGLDDVVQVIRGSMTDRLRQVLSD
jgi:hypothetical protein